MFGMKTKTKNKVGGYAFLAGLGLSLVLAVLSAMFVDYQPMLLAVIATTAILVGLLNVRKAEGQKFALYMIALLLLGTGMGSFAVYGDIGLQIIVDVMVAIATFFIAAGAVGVLAGLYKIYKD